MHRACFALILAVASLGANAQAMFKCVQDGKTVYQDTKCPDAAKQNTLQSDPRSSSSPDSPGAAGSPAGGGGGSPGRADGDVDRALDIMTSFQACSDGIQIWGPEMRPYYLDWRLRNAAVISRIENDRQLQAAFGDRLRAKRNGKASMCGEVARALKGTPAK